MTSLRAHRRWLPAWLVAVLLFALWTTASYACPGTRPAGHGVAAAAMADMPGCDGPMVMDDEQPLRCQVHCTEDGRAVDSGSVATDLPPPLPTGGAIVAVLAAVVPAVDAAPWPAADGPPRGSPPIYLLLQVLRN